MTITAQCRLILPRFAGSALVPASEIPAGVRAVLADRGLANDHFADGYWQATPRARGYIADPATFEA